VKDRRWLLLAAFGIVLAVTVFFGFRFVRRVFLAPPSREPVRGWMNLPYIARAYDVDPQVLHDALGLTPGVPDRRPLEEIAASTNRSVDEMIEIVDKKILELAPEPPRRRGGRKPETPTPELVAATPTP
jgi:hypothetical protein